jgi:hypothetical protein
VLLSWLTSLEATLRERLPISFDPKDRPVPLTQLLDFGKRSELLMGDDIVHVRDWMKIRNKIVHGRHEVSPQSATAIVQGVAALIKRLNEAPS